MTNGLFIDSEASLYVEELTLKDALLLNTGSLSVAKYLNLNGGCLFNTGILSTMADPTVLHSMSYFYNGETGKINTSGRIVLSATNFSNSGEISADRLDIVSGIFHNQGKVSSNTSLDITGSQKIINSGDITGNSGILSLFGKILDHKNGKISGAKVNFHSNESLISGELIGQEGFFNNLVHNNGKINFQRGVIDGTLINNSSFVDFAQKLELVGTKSVIQNSEKITAREIISSAEQALLQEFQTNGKIITDSITSQKHIQIDANLPELKNLIVAKDAELLLSEKSKSPKLQKVENHGNMTLLLGASDLTTIQNSKDGKLRIESNFPLNKVMSFDGLAGDVVLQGDFPQLTKLNAKNGSNRCLDSKALTPLEEQLQGSNLLE